MDKPVEKRYFEDILKEIEKEVAKIPKDVRDYYYANTN